MQERLSLVRPQSANGLGVVTPFNLSDSQLPSHHGPADVKHAHHERLQSASTGPSTTAVQPSITSGVDEPLLPPAYEAISSRVSRQL